MLRGQINMYLLPELPIIAIWNNRNQNGRRICNFHNNGNCPFLKTYFIITSRIEETEHIWFLLETEHIWFLNLFWISETLPSEVTNLSTHSSTELLSLPEIDCYLIVQSFGFWKESPKSLVFIWSQKISDRKLRSSAISWKPGFAVILCKIKDDCPIRFSH